jgi:SAM-dependent methyltransferase
MNSDSKSDAPPVTPPPAGLSFWRTFHRHWQGSLRYYGPRHTVAQVAEAAYRFFREFLPGRRKAKYGDMDYDFDHSVDTTRANVGFREQLIAALSGHQYFPTEPWLFEQMMEALSVRQSAFSRETGLQDFTFVDLGSGKGRVLLMAAPYGFKKIIGVEFMPEWHRVAQENIRKFAEHSKENPDELCGTGTHGAAEKMKNEGTDKSACATKAQAIEALCMDARDFDFPAGPLVVYLFNPFPEPVLAAVLDRLRHSLLLAPRPVFVAYRYPEFDSLLERCGWLTKIAGTEQWAVWRKLPELPKLGNCQIKNKKT